MFGKTNVAAGKNGDNLSYGDPTKDWANVGQADYMIVSGSTGAYVDSALTDQDVILE